MGQPMGHHAQARMDRDRLRLFDDKDETAKGYLQSATPYQAKEVVVATRGIDAGCWKAHLLPTS